jgi:predicted CXXCH cytochrome family protein
MVGLPAVYQMVKSTPSIFLFGTLTLLMLPSAASPAFDTSSKKGCAICHVMWLDDFRTDKETLIDFQPGNVLMKDTQGVVSSEDICYSCHDGYVQDSRHVVWKFNNHKTFVKPSKSVTVPKSLPLSNKAEIYCGTCHTPHGAVAAPQEGVGEITTFFREKNIDSSLCRMCHRGKALFERTNGHPLGVRHDPIPPASMNLQGSEAAGNPNIICQTCHRVHGARGEKIVVIENNHSELCTKCHRKQKQVFYSKHDLRLTMSKSKNIKEQLPAESGPCGACHVPHHAANKKLWARQFAIVNNPSQMCLGCHGRPGIDHIQNVGSYSHPIDVAMLSNKTMPAGLPLFADDADRVPEGRMQCATCHDVHRWDPLQPIFIAGKDVGGNANNSFLRMANSGLSTLCLACHSDKRSVTVSDHNLNVTAPNERNVAGFTPGESGPCSACHLPHNAMGGRLWAKDRSANGSLAIQMCTGCHHRSGAAKSKLVGDSDHPIAVKFDRPPVSVALDPSTGVLPLYDSKGNKSADGKIVCMTCHEAHHWDPQKKDISGTYPYKNVEGSAADSFLREASAPASALCSGCHVDQAPIISSTHDMNVSAPAEKNLRDQTAMQSGPCGACHVVHNSPAPIRLWARPLGPVGRAANVVDSLCTSCHSKGNIAEKKIPRIASHPTDRLIINTVLFDKSKGLYTPMFDSSGRRADIGNIACPSCHNTHRWGFLGNYANHSEILQKSGASKFLRTVSYRTVCVNCHAEEAPFRYLYFHQPDKRILRPG